MHYELRTFSPPLQNQPDRRTADQKATEWLTEIAKKNGRVVAITATPVSITQWPGAPPGATSSATVENAIFIIVAFD